MIIILINRTLKAMARNRATEERLWIEDSFERDVVV